MVENQERFFIITGGPGSGKSTLVDALEQVGFARSVEAGRGIIQDQVAIGGRALPWNDPAVFAEHMLTWEMRSYHMAEQLAGRVFFDRGVPDVAGYLRLMKLPVPEHVERAVKLFRYYGRVFVAPPWEEIFEQDRERKQDSQRRCGRMRHWHRAMPVMHTSWSNCRGAVSRNGFALFRSALGTEAEGQRKICTVLSGLADRSVRPHGPSHFRFTRVVLGYTAKKFDNFSLGKK